MSNSVSTGSSADMTEFVDFSGGDAYQSPSLSPTGSNKQAFAARPTAASATASSLLPASQPLHGPSHQYDLYKQQTGLVPGAVANTFAVNQNSSQLAGYTEFGMDQYAIGSQDGFDFNTSPPQQTMNMSDIDIDFDSQSADPGLFFQDSTVNPSALGAQDAASLPSPPVLQSQTSNVGRMWPGMHQQAALAKAQAQQRQQQQIIQQQQQQQHQHQQRQATSLPPQQHQPQSQQPRAKSHQPSDPLVEQKITQLLNSMRARQDSLDDGEGSPMAHLPRSRKDEEDMDEDERLLASEEGKKLSSKERRQLRNKVSARAFRSRRKEYISQLESEIATKVNENGELRAHNQALLDENKRLSDLSRMLLSSPSFSNFLNQLSQNPQSVPQAQPQPQPQAQPQPEPRRQEVPKDVNPYGAQQQVGHQQIGMTVIPEQHMDFTPLNVAGNEFNFEPQVYAVLETPEPPAEVINSAVLSGKGQSSSLVADVDLESVDDKVEIPVIERPVPDEKQTAPQPPAATSEELESDPSFALYHDSPAELNTEDFVHVDLFGGIESEKAFSRVELVDADEEEAVVSAALHRVHRITSNLDAVSARLDLLTCGL